MEKEDIRIRKAIVHILDSTIACPVLSDTELDYGSDLGDFLRSHIYRMVSGDEIKQCSFKEDSEVGLLLKGYEQETFVETSKVLAERLFGIMNQNIDIPPADLFVLQAAWEEEEFLVLLKMNYRSSYTHMTASDPWGNTNDIITQKAILPTETQKLSEAMVLSLSDYSIRLLEKKYDINGVKTNYLSTLFLQCHGLISHKARLDIVTKAVQDIQKKYYDESEQFEVRMQTKSILQNELEEKGCIKIQEVADKIFKEKEEWKQEFHEKIEKYNIMEEEVAPQNQNTLRKLEKQHLKTDTGIEIKIPMEQYNNNNSVEFITNPDGTISVLLKNIGSIVSI